ncbi:MAG: histone deacetylase family protein [bacterium]|nr:histone deacetylase family protein [bacterium]
MKILHNQATTRHNVDTDGEGSYRIEDFPETVLSQQLVGIKALIDQYIEFVHSTRYVQKIKGACKSKSTLAEVLLNPASFDAMLVSAYLSILAAKNNEFAITRPPGHHAFKERAEGFCFFNNIAIATTYLLQQGKKVCVIDIDGHHGNGTQSIFCKEERVLFSSIHQRDTYPYSGKVTDIGKGPSFKKVINVPVPTGSGDDVFLKSLKFIIESVQSFNPDHVAVSAGFDGYFKDKLLSLNYSKRGYYEAGRLISSMGKPTFAVLEGGYHQEVRACVEAFIAGMSGQIFDCDEQLSTSSIECVSQTDDILLMSSKLLRV